MISGFKVIANRFHMKDSGLVTVNGHLVDSSVITGTLWRSGRLKYTAACHPSRVCCNWGFAYWFAVLFGPHIPVSLEL